MSRSTSISSGRSGSRQFRMGLKWSLKLNIDQCLVVTNLNVRILKRRVHFLFLYKLVRSQKRNLNVLQKAVGWCKRCTLHDRPEGLWRVWSVCCPGGTPCCTERPPPPWSPAPPARRHTRPPPWRCGSPAGRSQTCLCPLLTGSQTTAGAMSVSVWTTPDKRRHKAVSDNWWLSVRLSVSCCTVHGNITCNLAFSHSPQSDAPPNHRQYLKSIMMLNSPVLVST